MRIWIFPTTPVSKMLFHVPGAAIDGGFTSGAVRIMSPEPGGRGFLEMELAMRPGEWESPVASWLMSMGNGEVFRVRLAPTPQVCGARSRTGVPWQPDVLWSGDVPWQGDVAAVFAANALEGVTTVRVTTGASLQRGHVIGHGGTTHIIKDVEGDTLTISPPLRRNVTAGDMALVRPFFTGTISNIAEIRATYDRSNNGMIQLGKIILMETITDE